MENDAFEELMKFLGVDGAFFRALIQRRIWFDKTATIIPTVFELEFVIVYVSTALPFAYDLNPINFGIFEGFGCNGDVLDPAVMRLGVVTNFECGWSGKWVCLDSCVCVTHLFCVFQMCVG